MPFQPNIIYIIITKNIRYLLWNQGLWRSLNNTYPTFLTLCIRCTNHLCDSCDLTDVNPHLSHHCSQSGLGSNTYLYLQIQIQIQIRRICICICIWSNFKPCICICICIWSIVFGVFDKYVFKYTFSWAVFWTQIYGKRLTWIFFINTLKSAILFQNKCRGLILPIPIGGCVCALDLACQWVCDKPLA